QFLTAAHCLYNKAAGRFVSAESVHLLLGYTKGEYRVRRLASRYTIPPTFEPTFEPAKIATLHDDWAILYVSEPFKAIAISERDTTTEKSGEDWRLCCRASAHDDGRPTLPGQSYIS